MLKAFLPCTKLSIFIHIHRLDKEIFFEFSLKKLVYERIEVALFSKIPISGIFPFIFTPSLTPHYPRDNADNTYQDNRDASAVLAVLGNITVNMLTRDRQDGV